MLWFTQYLYAPAAYCAPPAEWLCGCGAASSEALCPECGAARKDNDVPFAVWAPVDRWFAQQPQYYISPGRIYLRSPYEILSSDYSLTEEHEIVLLRTIERSLLFDHLTLHMEAIGGFEIPVLSRVVFECDGRGDMVFSEFVRVEDLPYIPQGYRSPYAQKLNSRTAQPSALVYTH